MKTPKPRYKTAAIRGLLNAAFDDVGLEALCLNEFPDLCDSLGSGLRKDKILNIMLDYFRRRQALVPHLLAMVESQKPDVYAEFKSDLGEFQPSGPGLAWEIRTIPAHGALGVSRRLPSIKIRFDREMQHDLHGIQSGPEGWFDLHNAKVSPNPAKSTFTVTRGNAAELLPPNTEIYFTLNEPGGEQDFVDGQGSRAPTYSFSFTTGPLWRNLLSAIGDWMWGHPRGMWAGIVLFGVLAVAAVSLLVWHPWTPEVIPTLTPEPIQTTVVAMRDTSPPHPSDTPTPPEMPTATQVFAPTHTPMPAPTLTPAFVIEDKPVDSGIFATTDQANLVQHGVAFRLFYTGTATISGEAVLPDSGYGTSYRITYERITPEQYACWGIVLTETNVTRLSRLAFDIKGEQGGEIPNVWLVSAGSGDTVRNYVDIEDYLTPTGAVTTSWQRVEIPLQDFRVRDGEKQTISLARLVEVGLCFEWGDMAGTIWVGGFAFEAAP